MAFTTHFHTWSSRYAPCHL